jgi:molybdenum cofactor cytidylyltransferase
VRSAGIILAAGSSTRMGSPKQLLLVDGRPLLELVVDRACASALDQVLVVLGGNADAIQDGVDFGRAEVVHNPDHASGMSSSLRAGLGAIGDDVDRAMVILGDQPDISPGLLDQLLDLQARSGLPAAALSFGRMLHPPVVLTRELWGDLRALEGDVGCRTIVRARPDLVAALPASASSHHPVDVDTPEDYRKLIST